jgi:hypothetical protein
MTSPRALPPLPPIDLQSLHTLLRTSSTYDDTNKVLDLATAQRCVGLNQLKTAWEELQLGPVSIGVSESMPGVVSILLSNAYAPPEQMAQRITGQYRDSVLLGMLGLSVDNKTTDTDAGGGRESFPNACLERFEMDIGLKLVARKVQGVRGMRISLALLDNLEYSAIRYSPSWASMRCIDPITGRFDKSLDTTERRNLALRMLQEFYMSSARDENYMFDEDLRKLVDRLLLQHFESGIKGQERVFLPPSSPNGKRFGIYLTGIPGVGKTTFVGVFARCFERVIRRFLHPSADARIVKVPLNAMTPGTLTNILSIQGISDWSVERVMEQALTKGHTVVLHLEEAPEQPDLQDALYSCVEVMLTKLYRRYPEYRSNVLFLITSNYPASPGALALGESVFVRNPSKETQIAWCRRVLKERIQASGCEIDRVEMETSPTSATGDVRPLNSFWLSVGHALVRMYHDFHLEQHMVGSINNNSTSASANANKKIVFVTPSVRCNNNNTSNDEGEYQIHVGWKGIMEDILYSHDGFFYYSRGTLSHNIMSEGNNKLGKQIHAKTRVILDMAISGYLTPAVLVLHCKSSSNNNNNIQNKLNDATTTIIEALKQRAEASQRGFVSQYVELTSHDDERKVLGDPSEIRGGLLKFIDDATNPKIKRQRKDPDICCIVANVNEVGSLLLRELLEGGDKSRTHRLGVSKRGLVFIVTLIAGSLLTPQLESRAHDVREVG